MRITNVRDIPYSTFLMFLEMKSTDLLKIFRDNYAYIFREGRVSVADALKRRKKKEKKKR